MNSPNNLITWFEIPVSDMDRAIAFYQSVFGFEFHVMELGPTFKMAVFPGNPQGTNGTLVWNEEWYTPAETGPLLYFNANPDLSITLEKAEQAGGTILIQKRQISPDSGYMGVFKDSEGNRIALHSME